MQSLEDGAVVYCLPEAQSLWPDAAPLTEEILCTALDGTLRLARGETERTAAYAPLEDGSAVDWREELARAILKRQRADGSWANDSNRYWEGDPALATSYALLALTVVLDDE